MKGSKSYIDKLMSTAKVQKQILTLGERRAKGEFGWRPMAVKVTKLLKLKEPLTHETVENAPRADCKVELTLAVMQSHSPNANVVSNVRLAPPRVLRCAIDQASPA